MIYEIYEFSDKLIQDGNGDISFNEFVWLMTKWVMMMMMMVVVMMVMTK